MLLHFVERLNSVSSPNEKLLSKAAAIIAELLEDIIKKVTSKADWGFDGQFEMSSFFVFWTPIFVKAFLFPNPSILGYS